MITVKSNLPNYHLACQCCGKRWADNELVLIGSPRLSLATLMARFSVREGFKRLQIAVGECCRGKLAEINAYGGAVVDEPNPSFERIQAAKERAEARLKELNITFGAPND